MSLVVEYATIYCDLKPSKTRLFPHEFVFFSIVSTPSKIFIEPENDGLEDGSPFLGVYSQVPAVHLPGCTQYTTYQVVSVFEPAKMYLPTAERPRWRLCTGALSN